MSSTLVRELPAASVWFTSPRTIELRPSSAVPPSRGEVRIEALFSGISHGSEMMVYRGEVPAGLSLDSTLPTLQGSFSFVETAVNSLLMMLRRDWVKGLS